MGGLIAAQSELAGDDLRFSANDEPNQEIISSTCRVVVNRGRWRSGTHQPRRANSWAGSGCLDTDVIQYPGSGRGYFGVANNANHQPVERRYFAATATGEFRRHDRANQERPFADAPDAARVL